MHMGSEDCLCSRVVQSNRRATVAQIAKKKLVLIERCQNSQFAVYASCRPDRVPMLNPVHHSKWQWEHEHQDWTMEQWKKAAWSDELCFHAPCSACMCMIYLGNLAPGCMMGRRQVMAVWGFRAKPARKAWGVHVDVTLRCTTYLNTAAEHAHLFMRMIFPDGCGLFLQDNALYRKARNVLDWCEEYYNEFEGLTLSLNSKWSKKE